MNTFLRNLAAYYHANKTPRLRRRVQATLTKLRLGVIDRQTAILHLVSCIVGRAVPLNAVPFSDLPCEASAAAAYHGGRPNVPCSNW